MSVHDIIRILSLGLVLFHLTGCSSDSLKHNTYQSLKSIEQQQCLQQPGRDCTNPESYNQFEKKREEELAK